MQLNATIIKILDPVEGTSANGNNWRKRLFVIEERKDEYPESVVLTAFGSRAEEVANMGVGQSGTFYFDLKAREYNGKWYLDANFYKAEIDGAEQPAPVEYVGAPQEAVQAQAAPAKTAAIPFNDNDDDLPF